MNTFIIYAILIVPLRFAGNGNPAPTFSSLIPETARRHGGSYKFLRIPDVEQFVGSMLPRLNIESVTRYLGNGGLGIIFEVELKPSSGVAAASHWQDDSLVAHTSSSLINSPLIKNEIHGAATLASQQSMPPHKEQGKQVEEGQSLIGGITESKITHDDRAALKITTDSFDTSHASPEIKLLFKKLESLNQKIARSAQLDYGYERMENRVKRLVASIQKAIKRLGNESPLKLKLSDKLSILDDVIEHSKSLPAGPKPRDAMTEAERDAVSKISDILASLDLDPLEDMSADNDEKLTLAAIADNLDYVFLALGEKYVLKKRDERLIEDVRYCSDPPPFKFCDKYVKQNELSKTVSQVFGYIDIVKAMSGFQPVCLATMKLAKADLTKPIKFLQDEYSSVQAGDEMFGEKVKARFSQFSEMVKDLLQGFFDLHLKAGVLHNDIKLDNLLLVEEAGKLRMKINDFDLIEPLPKQIENSEFDQSKKGLDAIVDDLTCDAHALLKAMEDLLLLNADQIGAHTVDDFELRLDDHESIKEPMTVRQLVLAHFTYLQDKIISQQGSHKLPGGHRRRII